MKHYPKARLCYTDTDSFVIEFPDKLQGFTDFVLKNKEHFDLSGCINKEHPLYHHLEEKTREMSNEEFEKYMNYGTPSKLKSENKWYSIEEFVALRPKQYSYITENEEANKIFKKEGKLMKGKGLTASSLERYITNEMYVNQVLKDQEAISCKMSNIQSKNFRIYTQ